MRHLRTDVGPDGLEVSYYYHEANEALVVKHRFDHEPVLERNAALRHEAQIGNGGYSPTRDWRRAASIPPSVILKWRQMGIDIYREEDWPRIAAMLDSPEYAHLRTAPGRISRRTPREYLQARRRNR